MKTFRAAALQAGGFVCPAADSGSMRWQPILAAAVLLTAGCLGTTSTDTSDDHQDTARDAASAFMETPRLVGVWGVEPPSHARDNHSILVTHLDDGPGDGEAPGWGYRFVGPNSEGVVLVSSDVGVIAEYYEQRDVGDETQPPIRNASVTSEEVAETLREHEDWPAMDENTTVLWNLAQDDEEDRPVWTVDAAKGPSIFFDERTRAVVDASTGEVLEVEDVQDGEVGPGPGGGGCNRQSSSGQVTPMQDLSVEAELGGRGEVTVETEATGVGPLNVTLTGPNGTVWSETYDVQGPENDARSTEDLPPGTYEATASTDEGALDIELEIAAQWGFAPCPDVEVDTPPGAGAVAGWLVQAAPSNP